MLLTYCRFLYPIYPLICVAASAVIESFPDLLQDKYNFYDSTLLVKVSFLYFFWLTRFSSISQSHYFLHMQVAKSLRPIALSLILAASHCRTFSLLNGYSAPLEVYKLLEHHDDVGRGIRIAVWVVYDHV